MSFNDSTYLTYLKILCAVLTLHGVLAEASEVCKDIPNRCGEEVYACWPKTQSVPASQVLSQIPDATGDAREDYIARQLVEGNFPENYKNFRQIWFSLENGETLELKVAPDYISLGTNQDYIRMPMRNITAQKIADEWGMMLPTSRLVDVIFFAADQKIPASPLGASPEMTTTHMFLNSEEVTKAQFKQIAGPQAGINFGEFVAGHKKDIVLSPKRGHVSIYGWYGDKDRGPGRMPYIQPEGGPHGRAYVDYSHGVRLMSQWVQIRSKNTCRVLNLRDLLKDPFYCKALSFKCPMMDSDLTADRY